MHQVGCSEMVCLGFEIFHKFIRPVVDVEALKLRVVHYGVISANIIKAESWRRTVMVVINVSEYIGALVSIILIGPPDHLQLFSV